MYLVEMQCMASLPFFFTFAEISSMKSEILSDKEIRIMSRQIQLPEVGIAGQEKIKNARYSGDRGRRKRNFRFAEPYGCRCRNLGITDNLLVEENILPRQNLYGEKDLGKQRAIISAQRLSESGCSSVFTLHNICLMETNILNIIAPYDMLVDATDNFPAHYLINDAAIISGKPCVYGSVNHNAGSCLLLTLPGALVQMPLPPVAQEQNTIEDEGIPALNPLYRITGTLMAAEALKIIQGLPSALKGKLLHFHLDTYTSTFETIIRNDENFRIKNF